MRRLVSRPVIRSALATAVLACAGLVPLAPAAQAKEPVPVNSPVVAKVGHQVITVADLERRIAAVPPFQLRSFGTDAAQVKRNFLERVLVREALLAQGADDRSLATRDDVRDRMRGVLRTALLNRLKNDTVQNTRVTDAEVRDYYAKNAAKFHTPERYALWIIATRRREEAQEIIDDLHKDASPKHWSEIAKAKSVDGPTMLRGGNIGFVFPDGTTSEPGVRVGASVVSAVRGLKDGQISPQPVQDGDRWVIVWRKQTMAAVDRAVDVEAGSIRQLLLHAKTDAKVKGEVAKLREEHLTEYNPDLVDLFDITPSGDMTPVRRPGSLPQGRRLAAMPVPAANGR
jgi:peptidyl-prolyl cis-trans isomerase C